VNLYRVFPFDSAAAETDPGGALFVADSARNRTSNIDMYKTFYAAGEPEAAISETLGHLVVWRPATFTHPLGPLALATYKVDDAAAIYNLDDVDALAAIGILRPSRVVTPDRGVTQAWARTVFTKGGYCGVRWWSRYSADWNVFGLWNIEAVRLAGPPTPLRIDSAPVIAAANAISKQRHRR
jgi:hypothetical protein